MTQKTRANLISGFTSTITDGGRNTAAEVRSELTNVADSAFIKSTDDLDGITAGTTNVHFTSTMSTKLAGVATGATAYTDELAQDAVGNILTDGTTVNLTYNDVANTITAEVQAIANTHVASGANIDAAKIGTGVVSTTEFNYLDVVTSAIQTQLNAKAATSQTLEGMGGLLAGALTNGDQLLFVNMPHGGTITQVTTKSTAGTGTATFKINTTALGGTANSVSSTETSQAHSSANVFSAGDDIVLTLSGATSLENLSVMIRYTRVYA